MQTPLVSIIIPTYNRGHLIGETLDSVLAQTYSNWECIVVDDGSTDHTDEILREYCRKDTRFQYYHRPTGRLKGANACRNYGFELSKGDYIQWFDSDDLMLPEKIKLKLNDALQYNADIIIDTHSTKIELEDFKVEGDSECFTSSDFYIDYILGKRPVITNDVTVKTSVIGEIRFDERLHKAQEFEFFTRLFNQKLTYFFINKPLTYYRETADSISKKTSKGNKAQVESLIYLSKLLQKRHYDNVRIVKRAKRQGRKTYKSLVLKEEVSLIFKHFVFFKKCYNKSSSVFIVFVFYNLITKSGFDFMKPRSI